MNLIPWKNKNHPVSTERFSNNALEMSTLRGEIDRVFDRFFRDFAGFGSAGSNTLSTGLWEPFVDVSESDKLVTVKVDIPGVEPKNIDVSLSGNALVVQGERREESERNNESYFQVERSFGSFRRVLELPRNVNLDTIQAEHKHGVLTITFEKDQGATARKIPISSSK